MSEAIYAAGGSDANLFYATKFNTPDPYVFVRTGGKTIIAVGDLEIGRARDQATVDHVVSAPPGKPPAELIAELLKTKEVEVPENFWTSVADGLRERGITVTVRKGVFWPEREIKTADEIRWIEESLRVTAESIQCAARMLQESKIEGEGLVFENRPLTAERMRGIMNAYMASQNCSAKDTIIAGGDQACDPHHIGSGPLPAHKPIVVDVFPRSIGTMYWGDMTRTFVKGKASAEVKKMYKAVEEGQQLGMNLVRDGADGTEVHKRIVELFDKMGYKTEARGNKMVGFFHGTGHGVGLDIHEAPSIGRRGTLLKTNAVVTVEPGLYYFGIGGIRLEDVVVVEPKGCRLISQCPKVLEIP
jgi:Xaa-Pro aminopeptidase